MIHETAVIGPLVELGVGVEVGAFVSLEGRVVIGDRVRIGAGCRIGVDGFGYELGDDGTWSEKPQSHGVVIGDDVAIGANTVICRGSYRDTEIGRGSKLDGLVFVAHNALIGEDCLLIAHAEISGSVQVGAGSIVSPGAVVKEHIAIGSGALLGLGAVVVKDVPTDEVWVGNPAQVLRLRRVGEAV